MSLVDSPVELIQSLAGSLRALAELPRTVERTLHDTNTLIAEARMQLGMLGEQVHRLMEQLDKMAAVTDRLIDGPACTVSHRTVYVALLRVRSFAGLRFPLAA
jgi:hypothetical protein